ncbi:hypothetical protein CMV30_06145 [Nibricoccus aquaticus]|uniref:SIMPL domain-containing protein n=1 Tax=Nibricoccus aquaticus TaxID=2576891 RepID=A0A290QE10_9BACT|nr:hypothetical protein [Nibricoccus aquaticus]ATC63568.1 hypothetical protein CMV30_06145 [Nibricoccus aquaticus]
MKISFLLPFILFGLATVLNAQTPQETRGLRVEVLVFSGRPNPTFTITDTKQISDLLTSVDALSIDATAKAGEDRPILGYNGIRVTDLSGSDANAQSFRVRGSAVSVIRKQAIKAGKATADSIATTDVRNDQGATVETKLLELARQQGAIDDRVLALIRKSK